jgi:hypothetical protein
LHYRQSQVATSNRASLSKLLFHRSREVKKVSRAAVAAEARIQVDHQPGRSSAEEYSRLGGGEIRSRKP